jgi:hypothetical protein
VVIGRPASGQRLDMNLFFLSGDTDIRDRGRGSIAVVSAGRPASGAAGM